MDSTGASASGASGIPTEAHVEIDKLFSWNPPKLQLPVSLHSLNRKKKKKLFIILEKNYSNTSEEHNLDPLASPSHSDSEALSATFTQSAEFLGFSLHPSHAENKCKKRDDDNDGDAEAPPTRKRTRLTKPLIPSESSTKDKREHEEAPSTRHWQQPATRSLPA